MKNIKLYLICLISFLEMLKVYGRSARVRRIVGGIPAEAPEIDAPVVYVRFSGRTAKVTGIRDFPHYVFRGVRFAEPPTGKYRFQRPRQHFLKGEVDATKFPPPCLQSDFRKGVVGDEDCLFLNIFTPDLPDGTEGLPVVVWIHGGGFRYGSASQYSQPYLVKKRVVVVAIQYRLGSLGFISTGTPDMPGNVGIWDMGLAVQFVRNYIGFFGGNPHKIVVMGHGSGASSAVIIALSKIAQGSTSAVVAMSGTGISPGAIDDDPMITAKAVAEQQGCPVTSIVTMIKCLQNVPAESIIKEDSKLDNQQLQNRGFVSGLSGMYGNAPVREGRYDGRSLPPFVEDAPMDDLKEGRSPSIPLLTGITKDETKRAVFGQYREEIVTKLNTIPDFLDKVFIQNLQGLTGLGKSNSLTNGTANLFGQALGHLDFTNYIKSVNNDINDKLSKVSEATGDVLFNLPAFLTVQMWSKEDAPTYLYRFEHAGKAKKGHHFLNGLPIVGNITTGDVEDGTVAHGDDLAYLFEVRDLDGSIIDDENSTLTADDITVRDVYTQMISDFAKTGKITIGKKTAPRFSLTQNNFIQILPKPTFGKDFRFCQMALWASIAERLKTETCNALSRLPKLPEAITNLKPPLVPGPANIGNIGESVLNTNLKPKFPGKLIPQQGNADNVPRPKPAMPFNVFG